MPVQPGSELMCTWLDPFRSCFTGPTFRHVLVLVTGAILTPARRTITAMLSVVGLSQAPTFTNYHRVLNRNRWCSREVARRLLRLLVTAFMPAGPVIIALDDTLERRWGARIKARGIYRDPVRSSQGHFVKASGLRWLSFMLLAPIPWANRVWALPFLTVLAPSERYARERRRRHKTLTDWAHQALLQIARWLPERHIIAVADSSFAAIALLRAVCDRVCMITRLRLDARLFEPPPPRGRGTMGRPRIIGERLPTLLERLADLVGAPGRPHDAVAALSCQRVVRRRRAPGRDHLRHGDLASSGQARPDPLCSGARCRRRVQASGVPVHGPAGRSARYPALVRPPLGHGGDLCRGAQASGCGDATPVVGQGDCANDAGPARLVLARDPLDQRPWCSPAGSAP